MLRKAIFDFFRYGQDTPPDYDLSLIEEKVRIWHGSGDKLADDKDVKELVERMVNADLEKVTELDKWGHITFTMGKVCEDTYNQIADILMAQAGLE